MLARHSWRGASGAVYDYQVQRLPYRADPGVKGNYVFCALRGKEWRPLYIGQGRLDTELDPPARLMCLEAKGAEYVHVHENENALARMREVSDLLDSHPHVFPPEGCQDMPAEEENQRH